MSSKRKPAKYTDAEIEWAAAARAFGHPCRLRILRVMLTEGRPMSPVEVAPSTAEPLANVSYHFRALATAGMLKLVEQRPRRGALQNFYVLTDAARRLVSEPLMPRDAT